MDTLTAAPTASEPGRTLADPQPRTLGVLDQIALWGNLGFSLLGPVGAAAVLYPFGLPPMSILGAMAAIVVGTVIGTALLGLANVAGAQTGQPAMVMLRGLFGGRLSYLPTVLNLVQLLGWAMFELLVISAALRQLLPWDVRWPYIVAAGALTTLMAIRPLGAVRLLRRYALVAVVLAIGYLVVRLLLEPSSVPAGTSWAGFWPGVDLLIALAVSWFPLAADYSRHSRTPRTAFTGSFLGFTSTQIASYGLGILAFSTVVASTAADTQHDMFAAFIAVPVGWLAFGILVARELDVSFANVYSTAVSVQNVRPRADRRVLAIAVGTVATLGALLFDIGDYIKFLYLIGSVFVPLVAVFVVRYFVVRRGGWDTGRRATERPLMVLPWLLGFAAYQVVYPGDLGGWSRFWIEVRDRLPVAPPTWLSASVTALVVAGVAALVLSLGRRRRVDEAAPEVAA